jgi:uncharacterized protein (DUF488 family)
MAELVYTIGHSTLSVKMLIHLLAGNGVTAVADVRSHPYSRINPQFNRESVRRELKAASIAYVFLGRELGARSTDRSCYINGQVQYGLLAQTTLFQEGPRRIMQGSSSHRIALMCAEKDPLTCHRAILICRHLEMRGISTHHIIEDGRPESHEAAITRLLGELKILDLHLFLTREDQVNEAYSRREHQIAYSEKTPANEENLDGALQ